MPSRRMRKPNAKSGAARWVGQPVVVVLKDGSCYIGELQQVQGQEVTISGYRAHEKMPASVAKSGDRAQISSFFSGLFGGGGFNGGAPTAGGVFGAGGAPTAAGAPAAVAAGEGQNAAPAGPLGFIGQMIPHIKLGMNVIQTIMPLMNMLKI